MKGLISFVFILVSVFVDAKTSQEFCYITPEDFGCVSDNPEFAHNNSVGLQKAIDYTIEKGIRLCFLTNSKYYIKEGLIIKAPVDIDFNMATLIALDTISVIEINDGKGRRWAGKIVGLQINLNRIAQKGVYCRNTVKMRLSDISIVGIPQNGIGIHVEKGYEVFVDNIHIEGGDNSAIGIKVDTHDCHFSDCALIDCHTAVDCSGSNFFERIHAWMGMGGRWINGSVFFKIRGGGPIFLHQCFSDTFDKAFEIEKNTKLFITQHKNFHNKTMWKKDEDTIHPVFISYISQSVADNSLIVLNSSFIGGLTIGEKKRHSFSNIRNHRAAINDSYVE